MLRDLVERIEHDRGILRVEQIAALAATSSRTLERRFRRCVGKSPKWVMIRRYRLIDAAERLRSEENLSVIDLAQELGYFDQAHFVRDFKALVGDTPSSYRRRVVAAGTSSPPTSPPARDAGTTPRGSEVYLFDDNGRAEKRRRG